MLVGGNEGGFELELDERPPNLDGVWIPRSTIGGR